MFSRAPGRNLRLVARLLNRSFDNSRFQAAWALMARPHPASAALRTLLEAQHAERERLQRKGQVVPSVFFRMVANGRGGPLRPRPIISFSEAFKAACRKAGCPGRILHDLRRTAIRNLERAGVPRSVAMKLTGHKTESVYRRYAIADERDLRVAVERLDTLSTQCG